MHDPEIKEAIAAVTVQLTDRFRLEASEESLAKVRTVTRLTEGDPVEITESMAYSAMGIALAQTAFSLLAVVYACGDDEDIKANQEAASEMFSTPRWLEFVESVFPVVDPNVERVRINHEHE